MRELSPYEGSYVIKNGETGEIIMEMFKTDKRLSLLNEEKYEAVPIGEYLGAINGW